MKVTNLRDVFLYGHQVLLQGQVLFIDKSLKCRIGALYLTKGFTGYPAFFVNRYPANRFHLPDIRQMKQLLINDLFNDGTTEVQVTNSKSLTVQWVFGYRARTVMWIRIRPPGSDCQEGPVFVTDPDPPYPHFYGGPIPGKATKIIRKLHFFS